MHNHTHTNAVGHFDDAYYGRFFSATNFSPLMRGNSICPWSLQFVFFFACLDTVFYCLGIGYILGRSNCW